MSKQPQPAPTASAVGPCPTVIQIVGRPGTGSLPSTIAPPDHPTTDPAQVTDCTYLPLDSSSSPAPGHSDKIPVPHSGTGETQGQDWSFLSLISPTIYPCEVADTNECNWLSSWSQEELQEMQREDKSMKMILEYKQDNDTRPELPEEFQTDKTSKALWYQWDSLEVKNGLLYRKWINHQGCNT